MFYRLTRDCYVSCEDKIIKCGWERMLNLQLTIEVLSSCGSDALRSSWLKIW